jgi:hypothetical protein
MVFSVESVPMVIKGQRSSFEEYRTVVGSEESSFGTPICQDMGLGAEELN